MIDFFLIMVCVMAFLIDVYKKDVKLIIVMSFISLLSLWIIFYLGKVSEIEIKIGIALLIIIALYDMRTKTIPDFVNLGTLAILTVIFLTKEKYDLVEQVYMMIGVVTMLVFLMENFKVERFIGEGDYPIIASSYLVSSQYGFLAWIMVLSAIGFMYGILYRTVSKEKTVAFAPVLVMAPIVEIFYGGEIERFINIIFVF